MESFAYHSTRVRSHSRSRSRERCPSPPPLPRRTTFKRQRLVLSDCSDDDANDDYPYSGAHRPSRAVTRRDAPSRLERWGIWTAPHHHHQASRTPSPERYDSCLESQPRRGSRTRRRVSFADEIDEDAERAFSLRVEAVSVSRRRCASPPPAPRLPSRCRAESDDERVRPSVWSASLFRRRERCLSEGFEARERARCLERAREREQREDERERMERDRRRRDRLCFEDYDEWRRVKRTRTDDWKPLAGWRKM